MSDGISLMEMGGDGLPPADAASISPRELLNLYSEIKQLPRDMQEASLVYKCKSDDARSLLSYALSMNDATASALFRRLDALESRVSRAAAVADEGDDETALARAAALLSVEEALALIEAFNAAPAQLHSSILAFFEKTRAASILALCLAPREVVEPILPAVLPLLLVYPSEKAASAARDVLDDPAILEPVLKAYQQLSLSSRAAVACELPPAAMALAIVAGQPTVTASVLGGGWRVLSALSEGMCPTEADLTEMHSTMQELPTLAQGRLVRAIGESSGQILEAGAHLDAERWVRLVLSMKLGNGRLSIQSSRVSAALMRNEAGQIGRSIVTHPEQRSTAGYVIGLFLLVVSFFSLISEIMERQLLHVMLDAYILFAGMLTCVLELEISSSVIRDHIALPLQRSLAFLRIASGRGTLYAAAGLLAIDVSQRRAQGMNAGMAEAADDAAGATATKRDPGTLSLLTISGGLMLVYGALNLILGSVVAVKLKKLRKALTGPDALSRAYHTAISSGGPVAAAEGALRNARPAEGLNAKGSERLFSALGVTFSKVALQAVFLEIDGDRRGLLSESALLVWYHGHIGRHLKRISAIPPRRSRSLGEWLLRRGKGALYDTSVWASLACLLLIPTAVVMCFDSVIRHSMDSIVQLVINLYILVMACLMLVVELKHPSTKRIALHIQRYAAALLHPTPRGTLYLLLSLALLTQEPKFLWVVGFLVEAIGVYHIIIGTRVASRLALMRKKMNGSRRRIVTAYRSAMPDGSPLSEYGFKLFIQSIGMARNLKHEIDRIALVSLLDLDRDGYVTESDLLYWLRPDEADEEDDDGDGEDEANGGEGGEAAAASAEAESPPSPPPPVARAPSAAAEMRAAAERKAAAEPVAPAAPAAAALVEDEEIVD